MAASNVAPFVFPDYQVPSTPSCCPSTMCSFPTTDITVEYYLGKDEFNCECGYPKNKLGDELVASVYPKAHCPATKDDVGRMRSIL